jgi:hypothetical protein
MASPSGGAFTVAAVFCVYDGATWKKECGSILRFGGWRAAGVSRSRGGVGTNLGRARIGTDLRWRKDWFDGRGRRWLIDLEIAHQGISELHVTSTMHTRKAMMAEKADAFFILPGGYGTFEEMFEVLAWQTLKIHSKPVVLLNVAGFYDTMLAFLDVCDREGMLRGNRGILLVAKTAEEALELAGLA